MAKREVSFDETAFLQAMSEGPRFGPEGNAPLAAKPPPDKSPSAAPSRQRKTKVGDYEAVFLKPCGPIDKRSFIGLRPELYEVITTIVRRIGDGVSAQAFVENVLREHLTEYQGEINRLNREKLKKDIL
jgi:hypothetical protein